MIERDTKAFQSPLKCSYLTFCGQHSSRESHTYFHMIQAILGIDNALAGATLNLDTISIYMHIPSCGGVHERVDHCCISHT